MVKAFLLLCCAASLCLCAACSSEAGKPQAKGDAKAQAFPKLKDCKLELELVSPQREFFRGDVSPTLTFRLCNVGLKPVTVYEWHAKEQDNIRVMYAPCESGKVEAIPVSSWTVWQPSLKPPVAHAPLDLCPRNTVLVNVELSFIKDSLATATGKQGRATYALIGELNLNSVSARSKPFLITFK